MGVPLATQRQDVWLIEARLVRRWHTTVVGLAALVLFGCGEEHPAAPGTGGDRTLRLGNDTLLMSGDRWVFEFAVAGRRCFIVGDGVEFGGRATDHLVVKLDANLAVHVPTDGHHRVLVVDQAEIRAVEVDLGESGGSALSAKELLHRIAASRRKPA